MDTGQINMPPRAECGWSDDSAKNTILFLFGDNELDQPIVDQNGVADVQVVGELVVIDFDRFLLGLFGVTHGKLEHVAFFQFQRRLHRPGPNCRSLCVEQDSGRAA